MREWQQLSDAQLETVYAAASSNAPPSIGWEILADHVGILMIGQFDDWLAMLTEPDADLEAFAEILSEEVMRLADDHGLAPFDGMLAESLEEGDTEQDWLIREDLLPFVRNWYGNVRALELRGDAA